MGGNAFATGPNAVDCVRLRPDIYKSLCAYYEKDLRNPYRKVHVPPATPENPDHGDVDILVADPKSNKTDFDLLGVLWDAKAQCKAANTISFALPLSVLKMGTLPKDEKEVSVEMLKRIDAVEHVHLQLDVHKCKVENFEWECMIHSYGDLWRIIGASVTRFGLAIDNTGFHVRLEEIEKNSKKDALLHLTANPEAMMDFLKLKLEGVGGWETGFKTLDQAFSCATHSRFFLRSVVTKEDLSEKEKKSRETRPMYNAFVTSWLPAHPEVGSSDEHLLRGVVLKNALGLFGKWGEYIYMLEKCRERVLKDDMWRAIAAALPVQGKEKGQAIVALKTYLEWNEGAPRLRKADRSVEKVPALDMDEVERVLIPWVKGHWGKAVKLNEDKGRKP